jgi:competence protein ComFC
LNHALKSYNIQPLHRALRANSPLSYSGKSKQFRKENPRDFQLRTFKEKEVIVVDDIITTGTTLQEATKLLQANAKEVAFCLTLTDAGNR